jgi:hypothetical protein
MAYQNINQYVYNKWYLVNRYNGEDISLASDERDYNQEVVFSPYVIGVNDGNVLPININFNSTANTQTFDLQYNVYDFNNIVVAGAYWTPDTFDPNCITAQTLCDIGLTGTDNGLVTGMTGQSITITNGILTGTSRFDRYSFGREMKFHQVTGFTESPNIRFSGVPSGCVYNIVTKTASTIGTYQEFYGGFYQGFYKLFGFDYDALPTRMNRGWTVEMLIKPRFVDEFTPPSGYTTLNGFYPENENIFFYLGSRAENKYWHHASGETSGYTYVTTPLRDLNTCACSSSAITNSNCEYVYPPTGQTVVHGQCDCPYCTCNPCSTVVNEPEHNPLYDSMSNAIALRLSGDPKNPQVCVRVFRMTGDCEVSGTCITGRTSVTGYTFEEFCSTRGIYDYCSGTTYSDEEHWVQIDAVWERKRWYDDCDLLWKGGLGIITSDPYSAETVGQTLSLIMPPTTDPDSPPPQRIEIVELNNDWLLEKDYRIGTFKVYVNGMPFFIIENFEEIIPRGLDTLKERQIGVPFNMSIGGGTQGLHDNLIFTGIPTSDYNIYQQDPQLFPNNIMSGTSLSALTNNIFLEKYFAGSFDGGISQFRFYNKPLLSPEVQHNFRILKNDYNLFNPFCPSCPPSSICLDTNWITWTGDSGGTFSLLGGGEITLTSTSTGPTSIQPVFEYDRLVCLDKNPEEDVQALEDPGLYTYTFSEPIKNPILAIYSMGRDAPLPTITASISANTPFVVYCSATSDPSYSLTYDLANKSFSGTEGYGIIQFVGTVSSITLSYQTFEQYTQLTWGIPCIGSSPTPTPTPTPSETPFFTVTPTPTPTTTPSYFAYNFSSGITKNIACALSPVLTLYSSSSSLSPGDSLWDDPELTIPAEGPFYADGFQYYEMDGSSNIIMVGPTACAP